MSTFKQSCPGCDRALELPADAKRRLGKCPACDTTFTIGEQQAAPPASAPALADDEIASQRIPLAVDDDAATAENVSPTTETQNRELPHGNDKLHVTARDIEDVLSMTLSIFRTRMWALIWPMLITVIAAGLLVVLPLYLLYDFYAGGSKTWAAVGLVLVGPVSFVCSVYMWLVLVRAHLLVARGQEASFSEIAPPAVIFYRGLGLSLFAFLIAAAACLVMYMLIVMINATGAVVLVFILKLLSLLVAVFLCFVVTWYSWAWMYICGDGKGTAEGSVRAALAVAQENRLTSFFLVLISVVLALVGTLMCLVGQLVTGPLTVLMFAVAYLMMTGQATNDPRATKR